MKHSLILISWLDCWWLRLTSTEICTICLDISLDISTSFRVGRSLDISTCMFWLIMSVFVLCVKIKVQFDDTSSGSLVIHTKNFHLWKANWPVTSFWNKFLQDGLHHWLQMKEIGLWTIHSLKLQLILLILVMVMQLYFALHLIECDSL